MHSIVSEAGPVHSLPPFLLSEVLFLVLVCVPIPSHVAEQVPSIHPPQTQSTVGRVVVARFVAVVIVVKVVVRRGVVVVVRAVK